MDNIFSVNTIIIIFIILFPGIIIRRSFYSNKFSKQFYKGQFSERVITTLFWGIINIIVAFSICFLFFKIFFKTPCIPCTIQSIAFKIFTFDITKQGYLFTNFKYFDVFIYISLFIFNLFVLPFLIGRMAFIIIRKFKLDLKHGSLTFSNHWHYFFKGEIVHKAESKFIDKETIDFRTNRANLTIVDVLTIEGDKKYLYKGILLDYNLKESNEDLDSLVLYQPVKKNYDKDIDITGVKNPLDFEKIPGNFLLIPYASVLNLNVTIKPFDKDVQKTLKEPVDDVVINSKVSTEVVLNNDTSTAGCLLIIAFFVIIYLVSKYSYNISYIRYTIGLFFTITAIGWIQTLFTNLTKKFSINKLFWCIVAILLSYIIIIWIFNIRILNIINLFYSFFTTVDWTRLYFWKY